MSGTTEARNVAPEGVAAEDAERLARRAEKLKIIREIAILNARQDAIKQLAAERRKRLELLMSRDGDRGLVDLYGEAKFTSRRSVTVTDQKAAARLFSRDILAEYFKPDVAFVEACVKARKDVSSALTVGVSEEFRVERARTRDAKARAQEIIESTKQETEKAVAALARRLLRDNPNDE